MTIPRVNLDGIKALSATSSGHDRPAGAAQKPQTQDRRPPRDVHREAKPRGDSLMGQWLGRFLFEVDHRQTGMEAQFVIFSQAQRMMPALFTESMETLLVAGGMSNMEWQALHFMLIKMMALSQKAKIKMARMDIKDEAELAAELERIEKPLVDYLERLKTAHERDFSERE
ncbi:TPA: hypothetical protein DEP34_02465 [Candidatus Uhrbacteria bacterium]|uniref:Uncharacterized protein n=2 Tax=Candidatus Uhriibacteriota TaxID=1752732 RepID=A0A0G1T6X9_9BACT|nr:MAG: hypothetical protein UX57_C0006G0015 [Candidatus Uhrbacteria bacterium GW2011_GWE2_46_68]HCB19227.1 hypothetical protein [Candidatus Uhrbacteria bacterium]